MNYEQLINQIGDNLRVHPSQIDKIIKTAPFRYKHYEEIWRQEVYSSSIPCVEISAEMASKKYFVTDAGS